MKTLLVKRLDSQLPRVHEQPSPLPRCHARDADDVPRPGHIYIAPNLHVSDYILEGREDELIAAIAEASETDSTITVCEPERFPPRVSARDLNTTLPRF